MNIGRFEIVRELGRGAQSVVYLARDPQLEREIAIKTLHFARPDPGQNATLLAEARTVGKLRHPNLVPIYEAGEEGGDLYLVFEYVPGQNLAELIAEQGAVQPLRACTLLRQILGAVASAHAAGIIHRDLKPSNILLDESGMARVMDFGIATRRQGRREGEAEFTGTPAYMAPEYVARREVSERTDVFAAGLILYELLLGERAVPGDDLFQIMHRIANQDIAIPRSGPRAPDERLTGILAKALARQPENRYQSAAEFGAAIDAYLDPSGEIVGEAADVRQATMEFLLRRMRHRTDFPALSQSVGAINKIAASDKDSVNQLSNTILRDFALTNKLLKLVNSAYYRTAGGGSISTVSRAVFVLGFDAVRNLAITVLLFEHMQKSPGVTQLMEEFLKANLSGLIARDIGRKAGAADGELAFICSLFHGLGRILSQFYFPEESDTIRRLMQQKGIGETPASISVLGLSFEELGIGIARSWGFPPMIVNAMRALPAGPVRKATTPEERMQMLAGIANELSSLVAGATPEDREKALKPLLARYSGGLRLDVKEAQESLARSFDEVVQFANVVHLNMQKTEVGRQIRAWSGKRVEVVGAADATLSETVLAETMVAAAVPGDQPAEPGAQVVNVDAQAILTAGIQDISNTLVEEFKLNDVLRIILETMYRAMGFQRVLLCIRDAKSGVMQARFGFGPDANEVLRGFRFNLKGDPDVFLAALGKGVDILISDIDDEHIRARIPAWYRKAVAARTFVLFPLTLKGNPVALIYADRPNAGEIVIPEKELSLLRTLRNQAIMAIKQNA